MARYGQELKDRAVARLLPPESAALKWWRARLALVQERWSEWREDAQSRPALGRAWTAGARFEAALFIAAVVITDDSDLAVHLVRRTALAESVATADIKPVLHGDNGSTLKATTVLAMLQWLGIKPCTRGPASAMTTPTPSLFRTAKYRPEFPAKGFASLDEARAWASEFVRWYNVDHRHSAIGYVRAQQRNSGTDHAILAARHALYAQAKQRNPARWSGHTRDWSHIGVVTLNPERDTAIRLPVSASHIQQKTA